MMKKLLLTLCCITFLSCNKKRVNNCNFLLNVGVNLTVNTNLPQFSQLVFSGNSVYVSGQGNNGIWLYRLNSSTLLAWDAADPSHVPSACSTLTNNNGGVVTCGCEDGNKYTLANGAGFDGNTQPCTLLLYRVDDLGNGSYLVTN